MAFSAFSAMPFSAFADTYKGIELDEPKFYFDTSATGWTLGTNDKIAFYITSDKYGEAMPYGGKKLCGTLCESGSEEGVWEYDPAAKGISIEDGVQYKIQFYNTGDPELTYPLYFDSNCLGHVAVCDGTEYENPTDSSEFMLAAFWNDLDSSVYGPMLAITSSGSVVGTCLKDNETKPDMFENFISVAGDTGVTGLEKARVYVVEPGTKTEQQLIDDLGTALGLTKQDVYDAFNENSVETTWDYTISTLPGDVEIALKCGDNVYYSFSDDGNTVNIFGSGDMYSWDNADNKSPFNGDEDICNVIIGDGVTNIGDYAFTGCGLLSVTIPKSVNAIGEGAFASSYVDGIVIPDGVETLEENVFSGCTNLNQLYIPSSVTAIKKGAFKDAPLSKEVFLGASGDDWSAVATDETDNETLLNAEKYFGIPGAFDGFKAADIDAVNYKENESGSILVLIENNHINEKITLTVFNDKGETVCSKEATVTRYMSNRYFSIAEWTPPYLKSGEYTVFAYGVLDGYEGNTEKDGKQYLYYGMESFEVTPKPVFSISNYAELKEFATLVNGGNNTLDAVLTADIVADDADWTPIGTYATRYIGTFDSGGHTITGLSNEDVNDKPDYAGLFGYVDKGGVIENVGIKGGNINGGSYVGSIAGYNEGTIQNCYNTGKVNGKADTGGIAGYNSNNIQDCYNTGTVYGNGSSIGGIVGEMKSGTVKNCYSSGNIISSYGIVGGVIGRFMGGTVSNCYNTGIVTGKNDYVGGVAGNCKGTLENCYNTGTVKGGSHEVGGVIGSVIDNAKIINCYNKGEVDCTYSKAGGITGYAQNCIISNCFNTGNVKGGLDGVGGIAGTFGDAKVENCYNLGEVNGQDEVGGIAGRSFKYSGNCIINCCYSYGAVICNGEHFGALAGKNENGIITNCYYDKSLCVGVTAIGGSEDTINVKGLTTAEMTGTMALDNMGFVYGPGETSPWLVKADSADETDGKYCLYYPHLKGFKYDVTGDAADWPAKVETAVTWNEPESYKYTGSEIKPTVTAITVGGKALDSSDYTVSYQQKTDDTWKPATEARNAGDYKAIITFTADGHANIEKAFTINKADLTVTANKQEYTYNGSDQGPGDTAYTDPAVLADVITVSGLKGDDKITSVTIDGQGLNKGDYDLVPSGATVNGNPAGNNYNVTYVNGVLKINPKKLDVTVFGQETYARYNGTEQSYTGTVLCTNVPEFDYSKFSYTGNTTVKGTNAGDYEIKPSVAACKYSDTNYEINWIVGSPIRLIITQCALDITANSKETNHGSDLAALTYTIKNYNSCYYNEDELNISISTDADKNKPGTYEITVTCEDNPNYAVRTFGGTYTVGDDPHYYGTQGDERFTCTVCGAVDDTLKAEAEAADKDAADTVAANAVTDMINALPEKEEITTADEAAIKKAREAYDSLTDDQKAKVTEETVNKLKDAEKALAEEKAEEATAAKEKAKAEFIAGVDGASTESSVTVKWGKVPNAKRYVIYAAYCDKNHKYKYKKIKTVSGKVTKYEVKKLYGKKLNPKKNVKVYIVAQKKKNRKWRKIFKTPTFHIAGAQSKCSNVKKITVKKNKFTLNAGKTAKIKAKIVLVDKSKKAVNHVAKFRYRSTNTAVVKVTKSGKIKAVGKGKATVFVYSNNGTAKAIKVTVK